MYGSYNAAQWQWIVNRYAEGYPRRVIAEAIYLDENTVSYHFRKMGVIQTRAKVEPDPPLATRMHEFFALGDKGRK